MFFMNRRIARCVTISIVRMLASVRLAKAPISLVTFLPLDILALFSATCHFDRSRLPSRLLAKPFAVALCKGLEESFYL
jgi:hypothetical protein